MATSAHRIWICSRNPTQNWSRHVIFDAVFLRFACGNALRRCIMRLDEAMNKGGYGPNCPISWIIRLFAFVARRAHAMARARGGLGAGVALGPNAIAAAATSI
jgi:hypothetical protein